MRKTFVDILTEMARKDYRIMCVIGDTGFSVFEDFEREFGARFVNVGIAEQNFVSFAAGLAAMGMRPYIYNVVSFMTLRAMEQIMLDVCYQENPVVLIGVGGGFAYGSAGPTHHAVQDIAMMSAIPNLTVTCPGDPVEMKAIMLASLEYAKPLYVRIGRNVDPVIHTETLDFKIGKAILLAEGKDGTIFVTGVMLGEAVKAREILVKRGICLSLYSMPTIKPIDEEAVLTAMEKHAPVFTIEEHSLIGGLGDAVGRVLLEHVAKHPVKFHKFGVKDIYAPVTGDRIYLDQLNGLDAQSIARTVERIIEDK